MATVQYYYYSLTTNYSHITIINIIILFLISSSFTSLSSITTLAIINVASLGANPRGVADSTKAFSAAWSRACSSRTAVTIYVPKGRFLVGGVHFEGPCNNNAITFNIDGTLLAPSDYNLLRNSGYWVLFERVHGLKINGGMLDGNGAPLWACKKTANINCPPGATSLSFVNSKNVVVTGLTSLNSQMFHIVINGCENVKLQAVKVTAAGNSPNTDGIHIQLSTGVTVLKSKISTGDDCVSIGAGATNLFLQNIACGPGHGISIGSLGKDLDEPGVENVTVTAATFTGTTNGVRIKSWARANSKGFARNIRFQHVVMNNVQNPILIDQNYCPDNKNCPGPFSGVKVSDVTYQDIHGSSATKVAVKFDCSSKAPCSGIRMEDVKLTYKNQPAAASCVHAGGTAAGIVQPSSCF